MNKNFVTRYIGLILILLVGSVQAATIIPSPPQLAAKSYLLFDADTGKVLVEQDADKRLPPASLTKLMTAYVADNELRAGNISLDDQVLVSEKAWRMKGSLMFIEVNSKVSVGDLLKGIIIVSGNDASVALAEHIAGSEESFASLMNATAQKLGMSNSHFVNSTGWPAENHYTTARDLATLAKAIIYEHPDRYAVYKEKYFQYGTDKKTGNPLRRQANRNSLLWRDDDVDGLKTGHTEEAGYCLVSSAKKDGRRLIAVVMGTKSPKARASESQKLLTYGFRFFENVAIKKGGIPLQQAEIWKGTTDKVSVGITEDLIITVPRGKTDSVKTNVQLNTLLEAPVAKGQTLGSIEVKLDDKVLEQVPIVALDAVDEAGFFKVIWDEIRLFFYKLFL
ncbi:D-alanyl-D-alanine carboxypeptidase family protein [Zooshikella ganghwensis]|uniref:serine-type D-Ala-D-Ala carboxypeptidase n=1 Tax=Zooshikella ganghwensis TaxID=202772 RepID=A0A4P9VJX4_9GAMM|nr:D-alanyl-D-alanine carboxypeptidase family protein [Zooshikella ganghwensis]RDH42624.1 D-alanyl-D-alanine carboxypeptidase [Zooshikella ganghwensis]